MLWYYKFLQDNSSNKLWKVPFSRRVKINFLLRLLLAHPQSFIGRICTVLLSRCSIEISTDCVIGDRIMLPHPHNIIIASGVHLGNDVQINQGVTIGGNFRKSRVENGKTIKTPWIGDNVILAANCVVAGPITVGSHSIIGAHSVCTHDVPSMSLVTGQNQCKKLDLSKLANSLFATRCEAYFEQNSGE